MIERSIKTNRKGVKQMTDVCVFEDGKKIATCSFESFVIENDLEVEEAITVGNALAADGKYITGGGAMPVYEIRLATNRPGDQAASFAQETGLDYATAARLCNMD